MTVVLLPVMLGTPAAAQTVFSDNFNSEPGFALDYTGWTHWNVFDGTVDAYQPYSATHGVSVDLDGSSANAGRFVTKSAFALAPGTYRLAWDFGKNGDNTETVTVSLGSLYSEVFSDGLGYPAPVRIERIINVTTATNAAIQFDHAGGDNGGFVLDNVVLESMESVPEPASLALFALALLPVGLVLRRR